MNVKAHVTRLCAFVIAALLGSQAPAQAHTIPVLQSSFEYGGTTYSIQLVGSNPAKGGVTTLIPNTIVPMRLRFANGKVLDAKRETAELLASPIYTNAVFPSGRTQYVDAVLRAELWASVQGTNYHVLLDTPTVAPEYQLDVPADLGFTSTGPGGGVIGTVDYNWFVKVVQPAIIAQLGVPPTSLTIFLTRNLLAKRGPNECCYHGNHGHFIVRGSAGRDRFTTVWAVVGAGMADTMSHEINEWANDPFNENVVPMWGKPENRYCNPLLEVGDPLEGVRFHAGGYTLQDVAYVEWFSRQTPSQALGGLYDVLGKFTTVAPDCRS